MPVVTAAIASDLPTFGRAIPFARSRAWAITPCARSIRSLLLRLADRNSSRLDGQAARGPGTAGTVLVPPRPSQTSVVSAATAIDETQGGGPAAAGSGTRGAGCSGAAAVATAGSVATVTRGAATPSTSDPGCR